MNLSSKLLDVVHKRLFTKPSNLILGISAEFVVGDHFRVHPEIVQHVFNGINH
jgi:hypothetical protein